METNRNRRSTRSCSLCSGFILLSVVAAVFVGSTQFLHIDDLRRTLENARYSQLTSLLPSKRPPDWEYRPLSTNLALSVENTTSGAVTLYLEHAPLPGVNTTHMVWWFSNHHDPHTAVMHPETGEVTTAYLLWHPRDHVSSCYQSGYPNTHIHILEILNSKRGYTPADPPLTPAENEEVDQYKDAQTLVTGIAQITQLDSTAVQLEFAIPPITAPFSIIRHSWVDSPEGLRVKTNLTLGTEVSNEWAKKLLRITNGLALRLSMPHIEAWLHRFATHCVEEFGTLPHFVKDYFEGRLQPPEGTKATVLPAGFQCPGDDMSEVVKNFKSWVQGFLSPQ